MYFYCFVARMYTAWARWPRKHSACQALTCGHLRTQRRSRGGRTFLVVARDAYFLPRSRLALAFVAAVATAAVCARHVGLRYRLKECRKRVAHEQCDGIGCGHIDYRRNIGGQLRTRDLGYQPVRGRRDVAVRGDGLRRRRDSTVLAQEGGAWRKSGRRWMA